jgi:hypothetical protein
LWYIDSLVLRNPLLRKAAKRYKQAWEKNSDMKIDKTTYKDRKERQIAMTADHTSRPDKVLFFATHIFCFLRADPHCTHCQAAWADTQTKACQRVQSCQHFHID